MTDNYGNYDNYNNYDPPEIKINQDIRRLMYGINNYPGEDASRALRNLEVIIGSIQKTNNDGNSLYDMVISTRIGDDQAGNEENNDENNNENNDGDENGVNNQFNIDSDIYADQQQKVKHRAGLYVYVYAYLSGKMEVADLLMYYINDTETVFNEVDVYGYTFADYVFENKNFELYYKIVENGGRLHYYSGSGAPVPGEESLPERNAENAGQEFIHYTNSNFKKMINKYVNSKKELTNEQRATLRKKMVYLPPAPPASIGAYKHTVTNDPAFGHKTFRKRRYGSKKDLIMPVESRGLQDWIQAQTDYITSSKRIAYIVKSYTRHGDEFVNMYLRNILFDDKGVLHPRAQKLLQTIREHRQSIPYMYQILDNYERIIKIYKKLVKSKKIEPYGTDFPSRGEIESGIHMRNIFQEREPLPHKISQLFDTFSNLFDRREILEELLQLYSYDLNTIIEKSPKLPDSILVYRGSKLGQQVKDGKTDYVLPGFLSTSLNFFIPLKRFAEYHFPVFACCLYEIKIPKHIPVLYAAAVSHFKKEYEILIPSHSHIHSSDKLLLKRIYGYEDRVLVTEMEVKGIRGIKSRTARRLTHRITRKTMSKRSVRKSRKALGSAGRP